MSPVTSGVRQLKAWLPTLCAPFAGGLKLIAKGIETGVSRHHKKTPFGVPLQAVSMQTTCKGAIYVA